MKRVVLLVMFFYASQVSAQEFNKALNKDSLFQAILQQLPQERQAYLKKMYDEGSDGEKEFFIIMFSMPVSSKKELIENIESNYDQVNALRIEYAKLIPEGYRVSIEVNPANKLTNLPESFDLGIEKKEGNGTVYSKEWG